MKLQSSSFLYNFVALAKIFMFKNVKTVGKSYKLLKNFIKYRILDVINCL